MPDDSLILRLASADPAVREQSAGELFSCGGALVAPILANWLPDAEFRDSVGSRSPQLTVGVAVFQDTFERIRSANGNPRLADVPPDQDAVEFQVRLNGVQLDILTTKLPGGTGAIARFLEKFGEGIQQVEIDVANVDGATEILQSRHQLAPLYPATRAGADGTRVNFFLVSRPDGRKVLIELVEK